MALSAAKELKIVSWVMAIVGVILAMYVYIVPDLTYVPLVISGFLIAYGFAHIYRIRQYR